MPIEMALTPGGTYVLDDYSFIQVVAVSDERVRYRARGRAWSWHRHPRIVERAMARDSLRRRILAEVDGGFFPDFVVPGPHRFRHPAAAISSLRRHLAERAAQWPFAALR